MDELEDELEEEEDEYIQNLPEYDEDKEEDTKPPTCWQKFWGDVQLVFDKYGNRFVLTESNTFRKYWEPFVTLLLVYTSTVFPYKLCFLDFMLVEEGTDPPTYAALEVISTIVDVGFWADLVISFAMSYKVDDEGTEVTQMSLIVLNYMKSTFWLNLIACLPPEAFAPLIEAMVSGDTMGGNVNQVTRFTRLQRMSRLVRLTRVVRLVRILKFLKVMMDSEVVKQASKSKGVRVMNLITALFWTVHLLACFWYLIASVESTCCTHRSNTWVGRRGILDEGDGLQWLHSMYFVLTVVTTVGFGDIHAVTELEIIYVFITMLVGAVWHSIIVSEVINTVMVEDEITVARKKKKDLISAYAQHAELDDECLEELHKWADSTESIVKEYDRNEMRKLLTSGSIPRNLLGDIPKHLFMGRLTGDWKLEDTWPEEHRDHRYHPEENPDAWKNPHSADWKPDFKDLSLEKTPVYHHDKWPNFYLRMKEKKDPRHQNRFVRVCSMSCPSGAIPPRFLVLMAMALERQYFLAGEIVYQLYDHPFNIFLVVTGVFASLQSEAGCDAAPQGGAVQADGNITFGGVPSLQQGSSGGLLGGAKAPSQNWTSTPTTGSHPISGLFSKTSGKEDNNHSINSKDLYPYRLYCCGNYFGDFEITASLAPNHSSDSSHHRRSTVRCEANGSTLVFNKQNFSKICEEFPHFHKAWALAATRREKKRLVALGRHPKMTYRNLAATIVQKGFRQWRNGTLVCANFKVKKKAPVSDDKASEAIGHDDVENKMPSVKASEQYRPSGAPGSKVGVKEESVTGMPTTLLPPGAKAAPKEGNAVAVMRADVRSLREELRQALLILQEEQGNVPD
jgi:hypothetical protein